MSLAALALMAAIGPSAPQAVDVNAVWKDFQGKRYIAMRDSVEAVHGRRATFDELSPGIAAYYGAALCLSPRWEVSDNEVEHGGGLIRQARAVFAGGDAATIKWLDAVSETCKGALAERRSSQDENGVQVAFRSHHSGKLRERGHYFGQCIVRTDEMPRVRRLALSDPADTVVERALSRYQAPEAKHEVCSPFVAISTVDPQAICTHAARFLEHFEAFDPPPIDAWIEIHHYDASSRLAEHALVNDGIMCTEAEMFGYYDERSHAVAYRAKPGQFGTLRHELVHAFRSSADALGPRWFEEGFAALYEVTNAEFRAGKNPWREKLLSDVQRSNDDILRSLTRASPSQMQYGWSQNEPKSFPARESVARRLMMNLQHQGELVEFISRAECKLAGLDEGELSTSDWIEILNATRSDGAAPECTEHRFEDEAAAGVRPSALRSAEEGAAATEEVSLPPAVEPGPESPRSGEWVSCCTVGFRDGGTPGSLGLMLGLLALSRRRRD
ncbi:MAG: hypothetical protein AAF799_22315 [Myxococcota bacterium]